MFPLLLCLSVLGFPIHRSAYICDIDTCAMCDIHSSISQIQCQSVRASYCLHLSCTIRLLSFRILDIVLWLFSFLILLKCIHSVQHRKPPSFAMTSGESTPPSCCSSENFTVCSSLISLSPACFVLRNICKLHSLKYVGEFQIVLAAHEKGFSWLKSIRFQMTWIQNEQLIIIVHLKSS